MSEVSKPHIKRTPREILETGAAWVTETELADLVEQLEVAREALERIARDYSPAKRAGAEAALALTRIDLGSNPAKERP